MLNWDLLGADYLALEGIGSFVPTDVTTVTSSTSLVAAREDIIAEELGSEFSEDSSTPQFHYFLSGTGMRESKATMIMYRGILKYMCVCLCA